MVLPVYQHVMDRLIVQNIHKDMITKHVSIFSKSSAKQQWVILRVTPGGDQIPKYWYYVSNFPIWTI